MRSDGEDSEVDWGAVEGCKEVRRTQIHEV
jgi:hypothetical protein